MCTMQKKIVNALPVEVVGFLWLLLFPSSHLVTPVVVIVKNFANSWKPL